jgi:hypothetical protein
VLAKRLDLLLDPAEAILEVIALCLERLDDLLHA